MKNSFQNFQNQPYPVFLPHPETSFKSNVTFNSTFSSNPSNVRDILALKHLSIERDKSTGRLKSKDGRRKDPNTPLAKSLAENYKRYEVLFIKLRSFCINPNHCGMLNTPELTTLTYPDVCNMLEFLRQSGVIDRYTKYSGGAIFIQFRPEAVQFFVKNFADVYLNDIVLQNIHPDEIYHDVVLLDTNAASYSTLKCDVLYRKGGTVYFVVSALSTNILIPAQLDRLRKIANRLRKNIIFIVSPSVSCSAVGNTLTSIVDPGVSFKVVTFASPSQFKLL